MVNIECLLDGRDVDIHLSIKDEEDYGSVVKEIVRMLKEDELSGELASGPYEFEVMENAIIFSNKYFGASITRWDIEQAINAHVGLATGS